MRISASTRSRTSRAAASDAAALKRAVVGVAAATACAANFAFTSADSAPPFPDPPAEDPPDDVDVPLPSASSRPPSLSLACLDSRPCPGVPSVPFWTLFQLLNSPKRSGRACCLRLTRLHAAPPSSP